MKRIIVIILIVTVAACSAKREEEKDYSKDLILIKQVINNSIAWAKNKDLNILYSAIADDTAFLEIHPDNSIVRGISQFKENEKFWMNPNFKAISYEIRDLDIQISQSGTVAWWYCILDDINEWKGQPANWVNTRWTGVVEKRNGKWVIVQQHFSFATE